MSMYRLEIRKSYCEHLVFGVGSSLKRLDVTPRCRPHAANERESVVPVLELL